MKALARLLGLLALAASMATTSAAQSSKEKDKDKGTGKAKPPARTFTDEDLKKYKDKPKDESTEGQEKTAQPSSTESAPAEGAPSTGRRQRRAREYGGHQEAEPPAPPQNPVASSDQMIEPTAEPPASQTSSPEEAEWRGRAAQANRAVAEAQNRIKGIEAQMAELRDRLNPMSANYVLGGNSTAGPGQIYEIEERLRNLDSELSGARTDLADAEKAFQQFLEEARSAGASPAWLRP